MTQLSFRCVFLTFQVQGGSQLTLCYWLLTQLYWGDRAYFAWFKSFKTWYSLLCGTAYVNFGKYSVCVWKVFVCSASVLRMEFGQVHWSRCSFFVFLVSCFHLPEPISYWEQRARIPSVAMYLFTLCLRLHFINAAAPWSAYKFRILDLTMMQTF